MARRIASVAGILVAMVVGLGVLVTPSPAVADSLGTTLTVTARGQAYNNAFDQFVVKLVDETGAPVAGAQVAFTSTPSASASCFDPTSSDGTAYCRVDAQFAPTVTTMTVDAWYAGRVGQSGAPDLQPSSASLTVALPSGTARAYGVSATGGTRTSTVLDTGTATGSCCVSRTATTTDPQFFQAGYFAWGSVSGASTVASVGATSPFGGGPVARASADLGKVTLYVSYTGDPWWGDTFTILSAQAQASSTCGSAAVGSSSVSNLTVDYATGTTTLDPETVAPNTVRVVDGLTVILNEQITHPDGSITVNAVHITGPGVDAVAASASAGRDSAC